MQINSNSNLSIGPVPLPKEADASGIPAEFLDQLQEMRYPFVTSLRDIYECWNHPLVTWPEDQVLSRKSVLKQLHK